MRTASILQSGLTMHSRRHRAVLWMAAALVAAPASLAQIPASEDAGSGVDTALEEVVVTSRRMLEPPGVPQSMVVIGLEQIEQQNILDMADLAKLVAGFTWSVANSPLDARPAIRGQSNLRTAGQPTVGVFVDGNSVPWRSGLNLQTFDVSRIEVVKGPQSSLFGRGVLSGAINYVTRRPEPTFGGFLEAAYGKANRADVKGRVDMPVNDSLSFGVSARWSEFDGFYRNSLTGKDGVGGTRASSGSVAMVWEPTEDFSAYLRGSYSSEWQAQPARMAVDSNTQVGPSPGDVWFIGTVPVDVSQISHNCDACEGFGRDVTWATLNLAWRVMSGTLTSMTAYNRTHLKSDIDTDFTGILETQQPVSIYLNGFHLSSDRNMTSVSQELRFASDMTQPLRWVGGAYFFTESVDEIGREAAGTLLPASAFPPIPKTEGARSRAVFGSLEFEVSERLTVGAELRWSEERADVDFIYRDRPLQLARSWSSWSPRFTLDYQLTPGTLLYASTASGSKPGGFNTALAAGNVPLPEEFLLFDEETARSHEVGVKSELLGKTLSLSAALFWIDGRNVQVTELYFPPPPQAGRSAYTGNAGALEIRGGELEARWQATKKVLLTAAYAYTPARIIDYQLPTAALVGISTLGRRHLSYSSDHVANASIAYTAPLNVGWTWNLQSSVQYRSTQYATVANLAETGGRASVDLQFGVSSKNWRATAHVLNALNNQKAESVGTMINPQSGWRNFIVIPPDPRQLSLRVRYSF